jgi:hypothetical protein
MEYKGVVLLMVSTADKPAYAVFFERKTWYND